MNQLLLFFSLLIFGTNATLAQTHHSYETTSFYKGLDFKKDKISFGIGEYSQLPFSWDNSISSIRIPSRSYGYHL